MFRRTHVATVLAAALALAALALPVAGAGAADTHAPKGARADWLPSTEWVMSSWLPFDEQRLYDLLRTDRQEVDAWLNDRRTLGALAGARGIRSQRTLAERLVAPRLRGASPRLRRVLRIRALAMLTQAHLANHVLFHIFHTPAIPDAAAEVFGISPSAFRRLRDSGTSPQAIGARHGRTAARLASGLHRLLAVRGRRALRTGAMSRRQAATLLAEQDAGLPAYIAHRFRTKQQQLDFLCRVDH
jgi:hypothetical protein